MLYLRPAPVFTCGECGECEYHHPLSGRRFRRCSFTRVGTNTSFSLSISRCLITFLRNDNLTGIVTQSFSYHISASSCCCLFIFNQALTQLSLSETYRLLKPRSSLPTFQLYQALHSRCSPTDFPEAKSTHQLRTPRPSVSGTSKMLSTARRVHCVCVPSCQLVLMRGKQLVKHSVRGPR